MENKYNAPCRGSENPEYCAEHAQPHLKCSQEIAALLGLSKRATDAAQEAHSKDLGKIAHMLLTKALPASVANRVTIQNLQQELKDLKAGIAEAEVEEAATLDDKDDIEIELHEAQIEILHYKKQERHHERLIFQQAEALEFSTKTMEAALKRIKELERTNEELAAVNLVLIAKEIMTEGNKPALPAIPVDPMEVDAPSLVEFKDVDAPAPETTPEPPTTEDRGPEGDGESDDRPF